MASPSLAEVQVHGSYADDENLKCGAIIILKLTVTHVEVSPHVVEPARQATWGRYVSMPYVCLRAAKLMSSNTHNTYIQRP